MCSGPGQSDSTQTIDGEGVGCARQEETREEREYEAAERAVDESLLPILRRHFCRISFLCELSVFLTGILLSAKCLARLNVEIEVSG